MLGKQATVEFSQGKPKGNEMTDNRNVTDPDVLVVSASMFEPLTGSKGKFTSSVALFDRSETLGAAMDWAREFADRSGRQLIKVELSYNSRNR